MNKKLSLENILQRTSEKLGLNEIFATAGLMKEVSALNVRCYRRLSFSLKENLLPTIAVITPQAVNQLCSKGINAYGSLFKNIVFIVIAESQRVPYIMKTIAETQHIPIAASAFDEYYLESSIKGLIRERVKGKTAIHGVVIESCGMGIIIVGASSIGKTTSALAYVQKGSYWIADDLVVVRKNIKGELIARGHAKIKKYLHYGKEGIIPVKKILDAGKIKKETKLVAIIAVERTNIKGNAFSETKREILGTKLTCLKISISASGYFNENLLEKMVKKLNSVTSRIPRSLLLGKRANNK
jgi:serine kinase of HPr protein (carbohydrate metabolism regulator)